MSDMIFVALLGISIGSFLNVLIVRIPNNETIIFGGSHCTSCNKNLKLWHNIPILSWLLLKGKCGFCEAKIPMHYPIVEAISSVLFVLIASRSGINFESMLVALSFSMLIALSFIDLKYKMVPDSLNLLAIIFAILAANTVDQTFINFQNALLFAGGFTLLRFSLSYILTSSAAKEANKTKTSWNKNYHIYPFVEAMGEGDIMVAATMGGLLGIPLTLAAIFLSALIALPVMLYLQYIAKKAVAIPFVPFLSVASFIVYLNDAFFLEFIKVNYS